MKYLLAITILCYGLTYWGYKTVINGPRDNFGAAFPVLAGVALSIILTVIYVGLAFWNHRFL